jgi:hypothetical protein
MNDQNIRFVTLEFFLDQIPLDNDGDNPSERRNSELSGVK